MKRRLLFSIALLLSLFVLAACRDTPDGGQKKSEQRAASPVPTETAAGPAESEGTARKRFSTMFLDTFDTVISFTGFAVSEEEFQEQAALVHATFQYLHKLFDCYHSYEEEGITSVYTLNEKAGKEPIEVDPILFQLLKFSKTEYETGRGQTNIALGSVLSLWHAYRESGLDSPEKAALPPMEELRAAFVHTKIEDLILDEDGGTVFFADPELRLDVGAVAKGYAAEIVASLLYGNGMDSFIISAGGNVRVGNPPEDGRPNWGIGIQDPDGAVYGTSDIVETLYLHDCSVVTSGDYQRYYTVNGERYCHLIDPDTLMPGAYYRSVSIVTEDSGYADYLSTAAYLMPYEESRAFIESLTGVEALWVFADGRMEMTDGLKAAAKSQGAVNAK